MRVCRGSGVRLSACVHACTFVFMAVVCVVGPSGRGGEGKEGWGRERGRGGGVFRPK